MQIQINTQFTSGYPGLPEWFGGQSMGAKDHTFWVQWVSLDFCQFPYAG